MGFWKKLCCCIKENELEVDENTRLLPISNNEEIIKKVDSPFQMYSYGLSPPGLHLKLIPEEFSRLGILKIACGAEHILMLTETNFVIAAGNNSYGQCARDPNKPLDSSEDPNETSTNLKMTAFKIEKFKILDISAGSYHSVVLVRADSNYNNVSISKPMVWGHSSGTGLSEHKFSPTEFPLDVKENISAVFAGQMRSGIVTESGKVFVWGEWFTGTKQAKARELPVPYPCKKLAIGKMNLLALTHIGKVYSIGDNTYGELGLGREIKTTLNFIEVKEVNQVIDIAAGTRHCLFLTRDHRLFACGDNSEGQCGSDSARVYTPTEVQLKYIIGKSHPEKLYCGDSQSGFVTNDGEMFVWGDNTAGRLGVKELRNVQKPRIVEDVMGKYVVAIGLGGMFSSVMVGPGLHSLVRQRVSEQLVPP